MEECVSSNTRIAINVTSLSENQDDTKNDTIKKLEPEISLRKGKKKLTKKNVKIMPIEIKFNHINNQSCLHFTNETQRDNETKQQKTRGDSNNNNNNNTTTNNQIYEIFETANIENNSNDSDDSSLSYIEKASSVGSEDATEQEHEDLSVSVSNPYRDLERPYHREYYYEHQMIKHMLIDSFKLTAHIIIWSSPTLLWCFICQKEIRLKRGTDSTANKLIHHIRNCFTNRNRLHKIMEEEKESLITKKKFSLAQLRREYIIMPHKNYHYWNDKFQYKIKEFGRNFVINEYRCLLCEQGNFIDNTNHEIEFDGSNYKTIIRHINSEAHQYFKEKLESVEEVQKIVSEIHDAFRSEKGENHSCDLCNYENTLEVEFIKHLNDAAHINQFTTLSENDRKKYNHYFCYACLLRWYGHKETYIQHNNNTYHKAAISYYPYIEHLPKDCLDLLKYVKQNRNVIVTDSNLTLENNNLHSLLRHLKRNLLLTFPNIKVHLFGSRISGLALPNSDVDVFLDCECTYGGRISYLRSQEILELIEKHLEGLETWEIKEAVLNCRTPVLKILHIPSKLNCDIVVTNGLGVQKTKMIKCFVEAFPMCRELILYVKRWLQTSNQAGRNFISSYAAAWLVIYYLQHLEIFPSVSHLIELKNKSWRINGWEVGVTYDFPVGQTNLSFTELLFGFFKYYSDFDYCCYVICPLLGRKLEKSTFWSDIDMKELTPYVDYIKRRIDRHTQQAPKHFCTTALSLQDPFDLSHNITRAMNSSKLKYFRKACIYTTRFLKKTLTGISSKTIEKYNTNWHLYDHLD